MAVSRSDRNRSAKDAPTEKTFWDEIDKLKRDLATIQAKTKSKGELFEQVPIGGIIAWDRAIAEIPGNYEIVAEALGRYLRGVATAVTEPGSTGGALTHKHGVGTYVNAAGSAGTPAGTIDNHTTATDLVAVGASTRLTGPLTHTFTGTPMANHNHVISGESASVNHEPPFYDVVWIRRKF